MIYLASESPRRREILNQIDIAHQVLRVPSPDGEDEPRLHDEKPSDYVRRTAKEKALRALRFLEIPERALRMPLLSADTTVILDGDILGKPADLEEAAQMLGRLSGMSHTVQTAIVLAVPCEHSNGGAFRLLEDVSISEVRFKHLDDSEIARYCATNEPMGKAGAYGIQGAAAVFVEHLSGSYTGVMGLPAFETYRLLQQAIASDR